MKKIPDLIVTDEKILREKSKETTVQEAVDLGIDKHIVEALQTAWTKGSGLAAIQIGVPLRYGFYVINGNPRILVNPVITKMVGEEIATEGCLSIPGKWLPVKRARVIEYISNGKKKKAYGFEARLIQHEIDHMDGVLITDRAEKQEKKI